MQSEVDFFDVELAKGTQGLGITIAGYVGEKTSGIILYLKYLCKSVL